MGIDIITFRDITSMHEQGKITDVSMEYCIDKAMGSGGYYDKLFAIQHPKATPAHIDKGLDDDDRNVRYDAIQHPNATSANIDKALKDIDVCVRLYAIHHPNVTSANIDKALGDKDSHWVREEAMRIKKERNL